MQQSRSSMYFYQMLWLRNILHLGCATPWTMWFANVFWDYFRLFQTRCISPEEPVQSSSIRKLAIILSFRGRAFVQKLFQTPCYIYNTLFVKFMCLPFHSLKQLTLIFFLKKPINVSGRLATKQKLSKNNYCQIKLIVQMHRYISVKIWTVNRVESQ